ncbi:MAG TPA: ribosome assembly factor SBDS [Candidatus Poseidoniales archaeon]|nr:ribosome assembly factor SBDS [Euryarchaeota archaeon]DAC14880.1 MAG TPA: ribosome assembly factor SBDS [Candidatus Poseidoniales archaeon]|tara:strand:- start:44 stop:730 length:687 start_codon:yes stop_codon:yes gene_type:complete
MVSLDDAVLARLEKGGKRYELLVDPELVEQFQQDHSAVHLDEFLAIDAVFHDARSGDRPSDENLSSTFGTLDISEITNQILSKGNIQLTTAQRKSMTEAKRQMIIHELQSSAVDPKTKSPHPRTRIENALDECRFSVDPFKSVDVQVKEAISHLKPLIPLSFEAIRIAIRIPGKHYGSGQRIVKSYVEREEWQSNGDWVCIIEIPAAKKGNVLSSLMKAAPGSEMKEI